MFFDKIVLAQHRISHPQSKFALRSIVRRLGILTPFFKQREQDRDALFRQSKAFFHLIKLKLLARQRLVEFRKGLFLEIALLFKPG